MTGKKKKWILVLSLLIVLAGAGTGFYFYLYIFGSNVYLADEEEAYLFIPTGGTFQDVIDSVQTHGYLKNINSFKWVAEKMHYPENVKAGRYRLKDGLSNRELINKLRAGDQDALTLTFNNIRTKEAFSAFISTRLEIDSAAFLDLLNDSLYTSERGFTPETVYTMFIPNTYQLFWNTGKKAFFNRMHNEYKKFWNAGRRKLADSIGLSPQEVSILASIIVMETSKTDEMPALAGVYMNRLHRGIKLEADPTVIFALKDFSMRRVLNKHLRFDSPYNTYLYEGLPPGPIAMPAMKAIDAVLNYQRHDYLYFCARADFSGYHDFARTHSEHLKNARAFQRALNERKIMQ